MLNGNDTIIPSKVELIKKILLYKSELFYNL